MGYCLITPPVVRELWRLLRFETNKQKYHYMSLAILLSIPVPTVLNADETPAMAAEATVAPTSAAPELVWMVRVPQGDAETTQASAAFVEELSLVAMQQQVETISVPIDFFEQDSTTQISLVRKDHGNEGSVMWLASTSPLSLGILLPGETSIRHLQAESMVSLAIATKELLEALRRSETIENAPEAAASTTPPPPAPANSKTVPHQESPSGRRDTEKPWLEKHTEDPSAAAPRAQLRDRLSLGALVAGGMGIWGGNGPENWDVGGGVFTQWQPGRYTRLRLSVVGGAGPHKKTDTIALRSRFVEPGLFVAFHVSRTRLTAGPVLGVSGIFTSTTLENSNPIYKSTVVNHWNLKGAGGVQLSVATGKRCSIDLDALLEGLVFRYHYRIARDKEDVLVSPTLAWRVQLSVHFSLAAKRTEGLTADRTTENERRNPPW